VKNAAGGVLLRVYAKLLSPELSFNFRFGGGIEATADKLYKFIK